MRTSENFAVENNTAEFFKGENVRRIMSQKIDSSRNETESIVQTVFQRHPSLPGSCNAFNPFDALLQHGRCKQERYVQKVYIRNEETAAGIQKIKTTFSFPFFVKSVIILDLYLNMI